MAQKPLILITNDDGITAPGIAHLVSIAQKLGNVFIVAPDKPQSGMGHAITINSTLRVSKTSHYQKENEYGCSGTPVDCVKIAINTLMKKRPDIILSGINHGSNLSINVIYSGTMSAAVEGAVEGIPSIGFSLCDYAHEADFTQANKEIETIITHVIEKGLPKGVCLNVNIPKVTKDVLKGIKVCRQANAMWEESFDERKDPYGRTYYWLTGEFKNFEPGAKDTDVWAIENFYLSVVPTHADMTAYEALRDLTKNLEK
ncbi:MAG TPA: 5'/3'-nucleotidase SurE [Bacteroidia bacterium]